MKLTILGKLINNELSLETKDVLNRLLTVEDTKISIELLFLEETVSIKTMALPKNTSIKIYNKITGTNDKEKYIKLLEHYNETSNFDFLIVVLEELNESFVPLIGERLGITSFIDCTGLAYCNSKNVLQLQKPEYSGNVISYYNLITNAVFSFRQQKSDAPQEELLHNVTIKYIDYTVTVEDTVLKREFIQTNTTNLEDAEFVIVCGYGVGSKQNVEEIIEYANTIGAVVCGTKKIIDSGWLPMNLLIGQTGHIIAPKLCITLGVSGAAPLLNGIVGSEKIIAINNDKDARIFSYADYGIIGDYKKVILEELIAHESN